MCVFEHSSSPARHHPARSRRTPIGTHIARCCGNTIDHKFIIGVSQGRSTFVHTARALSSYHRCVKCAIPANGNAYSNSLSLDLVFGTVGGVVVRSAHFGFQCRVAVQRKHIIYQASPHRSVNRSRNPQFVTRVQHSQTLACVLLLLLLFDRVQFGFLGRSAIVIANLSVRRGEAAVSDSLRSCKILVV